MTSDIVALTGPFRYDDWDLGGRVVLGACDVVMAPLAQVLVRDVLDLGALLYGGNFAVRRDALSAIGGFDTRIEFHGEDTYGVPAASGAGRAVSTCYLWDHCHALAPLVDVWEVGSRRDLFSVTSLGPYPYIANSDFHRPHHMASWKTLLRAEKHWPAIAAALRANVDVAASCTLA